MLMARGRRRVLVLEKAALPRDKPCGEGLMPSGVKVLARLGIDLVAEGFPAVTGITYRLVSGASVRGDLATGHGFGVRRSRLPPLLGGPAAAPPRGTVVFAVAALRAPGRHRGGRAGTT